ncbi:hypothetical protein [Acinetobacter phage AB1I1M-1]
MNLPLGNGIFGCRLIIPWWKTPAEAVDGSIPLKEWFT